MDHENEVFHFPTLAESEEASEVVGGYVEGEGEGVPFDDDCIIWN